MTANSDPAARMVRLPKEATRPIRAIESAARRLARVHASDPENIEAVYISCALQACAAAVMDELAEGAGEIDGETFGVGVGSFIASILAPIESNREHQEVAALIFQALLQRDSHRLINALHNFLSNEQEPAGHA